jgi:2-hydroxychromene-2-carboxylate isomerase
MTPRTTTEPMFYFDFNSPYAYLAAHRVDRLLGADVRWQPIAFAFVIRALDRTPWSFTDARPAGMRECEERAVRYGLAELRWPPGWPVESYTLAALRAAPVAEEHGRLKEFSLAAFAENFVHGTGVREVTDGALAVGAVGVPTVLVDGEPFWGEDRLEAAARVAA